ncbi:unnamed protein product [Caenorhabditis bovis]|uniref:Uncharacterized protein n=1 Tax=Caenorhabditis bovis TaxID=2654633 RepID=A0A8S1F996_9PELO|nr:unnamed protein product [Caenorhabditis bovis]
MAANSNNYSVRDIILRYESEEDEFVRELEQMVTQENIEDSINDDDGPPILSVVCSLAEEIGLLRSENRRLKSKLAAPAPRSKNVVQRMSAMFENRGSGIFPRLRRINRSSESIEVRTGARERLSTPPRKEPNSATSTDDSYARGIPPIVRPELSDSDTDEQMFNMQISRSRDSTRRCDSVRRPNDHSTSACTSPSSASSSRDHSETMTTSRSSFLDLFGFRRRSSLIPQSYSKTTTTTTKQIVKKRRRKFSGNDSESSGMYINLDDDDHRSRLPAKPPRPASYYRRDDSEDSDCLRQSRQRKSTSFLNVSHYDRSNDSLFRVDRETQMQHEKDNLLAEIEELKMRNQGLVEQLREKSQQQSKLQCQLHKAEMHANTLSRRCALSEALERLTIDERIEKSATSALKKIEERLRIFENQMQNAKLEAANAHQMAVNSNCNERIAHQNCLDKLENLQREHLRFIHSSLLEIGTDEANLKRRLDNLPTYEALYAFTHSVVRRLNESRWAMIEKANEASRAQMDLIATQTSLLVTHAQMERLRIALGIKGRRQRRPVSFHGQDCFDRGVRHELNFYLPFKLQGSRVENHRRTFGKSGGELKNERNIEEEFLKLFAYTKADDTPEIPREKAGIRAVSRIESMMREMNTGGVASSNRPMRRPSVTRDRKESSNRRPISLVETEERRIRRNEETRRSIKYMKTNSIDHTRLEEMQPSNMISEQDPRGTPLMSRRIVIPQNNNNNAYDIVPENCQVGRVRKLERAFSTESRNTSDSMPNRDTRASKIQRSQPVSRIRPPNITRFRTMEGQPSSSAISYNRPSRTLEPSNRIASPENSRIPTPSIRHSGVEKKSWIDRLKAIGRP